MLSIVNESDFNISHGLYAVKFWATWCGPCKTFAPVVDKLEKEFQDIQFLSIDADQVSSIVKKYKVKSLPTILIIKDGVEVDRIIGVQLITAMRSKMRELQEKYEDKGALVNAV